MNSAKFGFWTLVFLVVANMIGAGVFTTSGFALDALRQPHLVIAAWIVGGSIALAGAISYGELARLMPESGGEYFFLSRAAHPMLGFVAGWVSLIAGFSGAIAFAATTFEVYAVPDEERPAWLLPDMLAIAVIVASAFLHGMRAKAGAWVQNAVVVLKLGCLAMILMLAASKLPSHQWQLGASLSPAVGGWALVAAFASQLIWISLSYSGFNAAVYIADEVHDASHNIPRALLLGTAIVTVLYVLLNAVFVYAPSVKSIAGQEDVAAIAAHALGGDWLERFVRGVIAVALFTSVLSMMMAAPRVYAKMADDGMLPGFLRAGTQAPRSAVVVQSVIAILLVLASDLYGLLKYLSLTLMLSAACTTACLFSSRVRRLSFTLSLHAAPVVFIGATLILATILAIDNPTQLLGTAITFALGAVAYLLTKW